MANIAQMLDVQAPRDLQVGVSPEGRLEEGVR